MLQCPHVDSACCMYCQAAAVPGTKGWNCAALCLHFSMSAVWPGYLPSSAFVHNICHACLAVIAAQRHPLHPTYQRSGSGLRSQVSVHMCRVLACYSQHSSTKSTVRQHLGPMMGCTSVSAFVWQLGLRDSYVCMIA